MKKILSILILIICVYLIYEGFLDRKTKYLYIGNTNYNEYNKAIKNKYNPKKYIEYIRDDDYRVMDFKNEIIDNIEINGNPFQNQLIKNNIIVLSIGINDLEYKKELNYQYVDELILDIEETLRLIRKYNKDKIYYLGYYNKNEYYQYINMTLQKICEEMNVKYINIEKPIYKQLY